MWDNTEGSRSTEWHTCHLSNWSPTCQSQTNSLSSRMRQILFTTSAIRLRFQFHCLLHTTNLIYFDKWIDSLTKYLSVGNLAILKLSLFCQWFIHNLFFGTTIQLNTLDLCILQYFSNRVTVLVGIYHIFKGKTPLLKWLF